MSVDKVKPNRRHVLSGFVGAAVALAAGGVMMPDPALAAVTALGGERRLRLFNVNTQEHFNAAYWRDGKYQPDVLRQLNVFLRDHRDGTVHTIDPRLLDLLVSLDRRLDVNKAPFKIICGYRSPTTNALRREESRGVAKQSYHILGQAVDINLEGHDLNGLYRTALAVRGGGVGLYRRSGFVHVDTGPVRSW